MADLLEYLRARLDEEEATARAAWPSTWRQHPGGDPEVESAEVGPTACDVMGSRLQIARLSATVGKLEREQRNARHIATWDPARVLAEVAAKRAVLDLYVDAQYHALHQGDDWRADAEARALGLQRALEAMVQVYADRPDFDPEWRA